MPKTETYDNSHFSEHCAEVLHYVPDHIGKYMPEAIILYEGAELVVRVGDPTETLPTVELRAEMPACPL